MATLVEAPEWIAGIYQLEESDPVQAGPGGIDNQQATELAKRTSYLKQQIENNKSTTDQSLSTLSQTVSNNKSATDTALAELRGVGRVDFFPGTTAPTGYLKANGATLSRSAYPELWAFAQSRLAPNDDTFNYPGLFGAGDGATTFKLPDVRGYFPRFWNDGASIDTEYTRESGSKQMDKVGKHEHSTSNATKLDYTNTSGHTGFGNVEEGQGLPNYRINSGGKTTQLNTSDTDSAWGETRVKNIALLGCIKY